MKSKTLPGTFGLACNAVASSAKVAEHCYFWDKSKYRRKRSNSFPFNHQYNFGRIPIEQNTTRQLLLKIQETFWF
jgi:hypothetical protein